MTTPVIGHLNGTDIAVIILFLAVILFITAYYTRAAGRDMKQFFLSGRNLPWYLAGTAMVATTFAADTPLAVTELVAKNGIAGNWLWWNMAFGGILTVFFFSKMWRRSGIMTDLEFVEFRYSGIAASILRGFRAIYLGLFMNAIVLGWVHKAMEKIFQVTLPGFDPFLMVIILALIVAVYASASGLLGSARTDSFQFVFALTGCIILAVIVVRLPEVGGLEALKLKLQPEILDFFPRISHSSGMNLAGGVFALTFGSFAAYVGIQWWSSWYPGADPGGGGYIAQRMMSAKDERHSQLATLWFNIAHYTLRPWPWILVALVALVLLPRKSDPEQVERMNPELFTRVVKAYESKEMIRSMDHSSYSPEFIEMYETYENTIDPGIMYPKLMVRYLPAGLLGLLIAVFMAAYMSTISSQLNWGTSYIINDFYKRFIRQKATEKHYVLISRAGIVLMMLFSLLIAKVFLTTIKGAWEFIINASAGMGAVLILRWYWWRINAWSEIAAMIAPLVIYPLSVKYFGLDPPLTLYPTVLGTTIIWLAVTFMTKPVNDKTLARFYRVIHPGGPGWKTYRTRFPEIQPDTHYGKQFVNWICGIISIYAVMHGTGSIIFHEYVKGIVILLVALFAGFVIYLNMKKS